MVPGSVPVSSGRVRRTARRLMREVKVLVPLPVERSWDAFCAARRAELPGSSAAEHSVSERSVLACSAAPVPCYPPPIPGRLGSLPPAPRAEPSGCGRPGGCRRRIVGHPVPVTVARGAGCRLTGVAAVTELPPVSRSAGYLSASRWARR